LHPQVSSGARLNIDGSFLGPSAADHPQRHRFLRLQHTVAADQLLGDPFRAFVAIGVQDALLDFRLFAIPDSPELIASRQS
jgi:hypothetical protein